MARIGTIKKMVRERGFGFIRDEDGTELFFHRSAVQAPANYDSLNEQQPVEFEIEQSPKGPRAVNVKLGKEA